MVDQIASIAVRRSYHQNEIALKKADCRGKFLYQLSLLAMISIYLDQNIYGNILDERPANWRVGSTLRSSTSRQRDGFFDEAKYSDR